MIFQYKLCSMGLTSHAVDAKNILANFKRDLITKKSENKILR